MRADDLARLCGRWQSKSERSCETDYAFPPVVGRSARYSMSRSAAYRALAQRAHRNRTGPPSRVVLQVGQRRCGHGLVSPLSFTFMVFLLGQLCRPHSVLPVPAQRPLRGSAPGLTGIVQVAQPIEGDQSPASGLSSTPCAAM